jgi:hypothetical protein
LKVVGLEEPTHAAVFNKGSGKSGKAIIYPLHAAHLKLNYNYHDEGLMFRKWRFTLGNACFELK